MSTLHARVNKQLTGQYLIGTQSYALGYELQASQERNIHVEMVPVTPPYVDTTSSQGAMVAISTASENPDRAMMFLNLLNNQELHPLHLKRFLLGNPSIQVVFE